jgi:hypothetical protein
MMARRKRRQLFVDAKVQGALIMRVVLYWVCCLLTITMMLIVWRIFTGPSRLFYEHFDDMWFHYGPALIASILLLPLAVLDILKLSNRFAGPLYRLRSEMRRLARGEEVDPVRFRRSDFWGEFAEEFNAIAQRLHEAEERARAAPPPPSPVGSARERADTEPIPPRT